jgi:hypothetical protein
MTMPLVFPRSGGDAAGALAPNAAPASAAPAGHDSDSAASAQFGVALSLLLGHVVHPSGEAAEKAATSANAVETGVEGEATAATDEHEPLTPGAATLAHGAAVHSATPAHGDAGEATALLSHHSPSDESATALVVVSPDELAAAGESTVHRDLGLLAPEFRDRLDRVIERMESEFGYKVEVAETYRSQARQDALYAQGRTDPGAVVTWTRASNHTTGRAADLVIDGSYDDTLAYERLLRIAREEGLRTLGARDPGHIELPSSSTGAPVRGSAEDSPVPNDLRASVIARTAPTIASPSSIVPAVQELEGPAAVARVAQVSALAPVARVAQVAQVAQVATIAAQTAPSVVAPRGRSAEGASGRSAAARRGPNSVTPRGESPAAPLAAAAKLATGQSEASASIGKGGDAVAASGSPDDDRRSRSHLDPAAARDGVADVLRQTRDELMRAVAGTDPAATSQSSTREASPAAGIGHADMSERIARLLKVQDAASDRPLAQVLLRLERPDGGEDRLRVDLRGNTVSATLDVADQATADRMSANVKELQRTLERHGFDTDSLTVRTASRAIESSTLSRAASASVESDLQRTVGSSSSASTNTSSRDRGARQDGERPSPDSQRQRSRREHKGER